MEAGLLHVHRLTPDSGDRAPGRGRVVSPGISTSHLQVIAGARERERICESPHPRVCVCVCTCAYTRASSSVVTTHGSRIFTTCVCGCVHENLYVCVRVHVCLFPWVFVCFSVGVEAVAYLCVKGLCVDASGHGL